MKLNSAFTGSGKSQISRDSTNYLKRLFQITCSDDSIWYMFRWLSLYFNFNQSIIYFPFCINKVFLNLKSTLSLCDVKNSSVDLKHFSVTTY